MNTFRFLYISYYRTHKMNIITDKMKNKNKNTTLWEIVQNLIEKYHTVGNSSKYNRKIPHCRNSSKSNRKIIGRDKSDTLNTQNT